MDDVSSWGLFCLGRLFSRIYKAEAHVKTDLVECSPTSDKAIAFITRTENNNGCDCFVENRDVSGIEKGNAIIIGDTTSTFFYQEEQFIAGDHIVVCRADWINRRTALFVKAVLGRDRYRYSYGRAFKMDLIASTWIRLPETSSKEPDWRYMSDFISRLEEMEDDGKGTLADALNTGNVGTGNPVSSGNMGEFKVRDLFEVKKGKRLTKEDQTDGGTPYVGAIDSNNGVSNYIGQKAIHEGGTISLSYNGSVGEAFYQPEPFWATDDVNVLYPKPETRLNQWTGLFVCTILRHEKYRYSYGRKWVLESMNETTIRLPQTLEGEPDWDEMERLIRALPYGDRI